MHMMQGGNIPIVRVGQVIFFFLLSGINWKSVLLNCWSPQVLPSSPSPQKGVTAHPPQTPPMPSLAPLPPRDNGNVTRPIPPLAKYDSLNVSVLRKMKQCWLSHFRLREEAENDDHSPASHSPKHEGGDDDDIMNVPAHRTLSSMWNQDLGIIADKKEDSRGKLLLLIHMWTLQLNQFYHFQLLLQRKQSRL